MDSDMEINPLEEPSPQSQSIFQLTNLVQLVHQKPLNVKKKRQKIYLL